MVGAQRPSGRILAHRDGRLEEQGRIGPVDVVGSGDEDADGVGAIHYPPRRPVRRYEHRHVVPIIGVCRVILGQNPHGVVLGGSLYADGGVHVRGNVAIDVCVPCDGEVPAVVGHCGVVCPPRVVHDDRAFAPWIGKSVCGQAGSGGARVEVLVAVGYHGRRTVRGVAGLEDNIREDGDDKKASEEKK